MCYFAVIKELVPSPVLFYQLILEFYQRQNYDPDFLISELIF